MKRYLNFIRGFATVSLVVLYSFATFFTPSFAAAEEAVRSEVISDPVELNKVLAESYDAVRTLPKFEETQAIQEEVSVETDTMEDNSVVDEVQQNNEEIVSSNNDGQNNSEEDFSVAQVSLVCTGNAPVITFQEPYIDTRPEGAKSYLDLLPQIQWEVTDIEDEHIIPTNNMASLPYPLTSGWYDIEFVATDSDGCVTTEVLYLFIVGEEYSPVCESGYAYMRFSIPENLTARLGTGTQVYSGEWFPVMYEGEFLNESLGVISQPFDVALLRQGPNIRVFVLDSVEDNTAVVTNIFSTIEVSGVEITNVYDFVSGGQGDAVFASFEPTDCPEPPVVVCTELNASVITTAVDTVTLDENSGLTIEEVIALFGIEAVDQDGEGEVTFVHNLTSDNISTEGTYTITITAIDDEGCESVYSVTLVVEGEDDNGGGGSTGSGCVNPNGCGGGSNNPPQDEPIGEILGDFSGPTCEYYISTFLKQGANNPVNQVRKLQIFLNDYMGENLVVDGVYGNATFEAVKRFQIREADEVLLPWGIDEATGIVRETTMRRINNIMCPELNIPMPLLYCETTQQVIYPEGRDLSWLQTPVDEINISVIPNVVTDSFGSYDISDFSK